MLHSTRKAPVLVLSFLLPAAVMAAVFALCGLAPFGNGTMGVMDMAHQYLSFLYSLRDILTGKAGLLYLPSMCLGGNMLGVAAYYLTSPLNLLTCLFPRESMYTAVGIMYILRVGLCGLTMCIYTGRRSGYGYRCLVSSMAYAFMAYMTAYSFNYLWQDCVILLPIVALGIARLVRKGRPFLYLLSLAGALYLNFYIGYILCIFSVLFFLFELLSRPREEREETGRTLIRFALSSLAAGALAAVVLLPAFMSLRSGKAEFSLSVLTLAPKFDIVRMLAKLYPDAFAYDEIMPVGLPQIFCGTVTAALTVLYFANGRIPRRRRILAGGLMALLAVSFWITALDLIWHCLNTPSWYNYRYSFLLSFLMAAAADRELTELREGTTKRHLLLPAAVIALGGVLAFAWNTYDFADKWNALAAVVIAAAACGLLAGLRREGGRRTAAVLAALLLLVQTAELAENARSTFKELYAQASENDDYALYAGEKAAAFDLVPRDGSLTRTESPVYFGMNRCEPMLFGYDGLSHYGSTISQDSLELLDRMGLDRYTDLWAMYGPGVTAAADTLLGIRWIVASDLAKDYAVRGQAGSYTLWENGNALPVGWTADAAVAGTLPAEDSFAYLDALYAAAAPEAGKTLFIPADITGTELDNYTADGDRYTRLTEGPASVTYTLTVRADGPLYGEMDIPDFPGVMVFAEGTMRAWYATAQTNGTVYLGDYAAGDTVAVKLQTSADITVHHPVFATEDRTAVAGAAAALSLGGCPLERLSSAHYAGSFTTGEGDSLLVFTLPWDSSWSVRLDGVPVETQRVQDCLMAVPVGPGSHTVELRYVPAGLVPGGAISLLAGAAVLAAYLIRRKKRA